MKKFILVIIAAWLVTPTFISASDRTEGLFTRSIVGDQCLVPIFHTNFAFPPEGGQIIETADGSMYFVRNYLPGCGSTGSIGTVVRTKTAGSVTHVVTPEPKPYVAPKTGCVSY